MVDDICPAEEVTAVYEYITKFKTKFELSTDAHGPGRLRLYGMSVGQEEDFSFYIDPDDSLKAAASYFITHVGRKQITEELNASRRSPLMSHSSSLGWLGLAASLFCVLNASYLQQKLPGGAVSVSTQEDHTRKQPQALGTRV